MPVRRGKRRKGSKVHLAVDTLGQMLALHVTPAHAQDRDRIGALTVVMQEATDTIVTLAYADAEFTTAVPRKAAGEHGIDLVEAARRQARHRALAAALGVRAGFDWMSRFQCLAKDQERLTEAVKGVHLVACTMIMWKQDLPVLGVL